VKAPLKNMDSLFSIAALRDVRDRERQINQKKIELEDFSMVVLHAMVLEKMFQPALEDPSPEIFDMLNEHGPLVSRIYFQITRAEALLGYFNAIALEGEYELLIHPDEQGLVQCADMSLSPCDATQALGMSEEFLISRDDLINMVYQNDTYQRVLVVLEQMADAGSEQNLVDALAAICDDHFDEWYRPDYLLLEYKNDSLILHYAEEVA